MYKNNPLLRAADDKVEYTSDMQTEMIKCMGDVEYFAENYCKIITLDDGKKLFSFNGREYQRRMIKAFIKPPNGKRHVIGLAPRQCGKTTIVAIFIVHYIIFNKEKRVAILANKEMTAIEILDKIKLIYESLPIWMQTGISSGGWSKKAVSLSNGNRILAASTASSAVRGLSINLLFLDEFAHVPENIAQSFLDSVLPTLSSGKTSKVIIVSTPKGMNHFYKIWSKAIKKNEKYSNNYYPIKVRWNEMEGRSGEEGQLFKRNILKDSGVLLWAQEFACLHGVTPIIIKDETGKITEISIGDLYNKY